MSDEKLTEKRCSACGENCWWLASCSDLPICEDCVYGEIQRLREQLERAREAAERINRRMKAGLDPVVLHSDLRDLLRELDGGEDGS